MTCLEIFEQDFQMGLIEKSLMAASEKGKARLLAAVPKLTLSPGYERLARHLMDLKRQREAGLPVTDLTAWEANGMVALHDAQREHEMKHPACSQCKVRLQTRFTAECPNCGAKFTRKK
jgi:hypothetical protein